jgi:uncharacterized membrane protein
VIGRLVGLVLVGLGLGFVADRLLAARRDGAPPAPIRSFVVIDAPIQRVWDELADIEGQPRWMVEMKSVRMLTPDPLGVGSRGLARVRILGIGVEDPVTVTEFEPPRRFAIRHEGLFTGGGTIDLTPGSDGRSTIVTWDETLIPPVLPDLGAVIGRPILGSIFQSDLHRFRELLETPPPTAPGVTAARGAAASVAAAPATAATAAPAAPTGTGPRARRPA